eukprot:342472-Hanusia_phi.AAC.4
MQMSSIKEIEEDIQELKTLLKSSKRPRISSMLQTHLKSMEELALAWNQQAVSMKAAHEQEMKRLKEQEEAQTKSPAVNQQGNGSSTVTAPSSSEQQATLVKGSAPQPQKLPNAPTSLNSLTTAYKDFDSLMFLTDEYNSPTVTVYLELKNVGEFKERVQCEFFVDRVDVKVLDMNGLNYRRQITNLYKDIVPEESSFKVKRNRIELTLKKVKGEFSYETWNELCSKKRRDRERQKDPMNSIMELMQDMYEEGDDNTRKMIGEAMMKSRQGNSSGMDM